MNLAERSFLVTMFLGLALLDPSVWMSLLWLTLFILNYWLFWRWLRHELARVS